MIPNKQGFTLLEILIAITIFSVVIGLAYSSYNASFHIIGSAESQAETYSKARITMERIRGDLESFYPGEEILFKGINVTLGNYRADTLQFLSTAHIKLHAESEPLGPVLIQYFVREDPDADSLLLFRSAQTVTEVMEKEDTEENGLLLCDNLLEVAFDYQNEDGENVANWGEDEEDNRDTILPDMITISLRFNDTDRDTGILFQTGIRMPTATK